MRRMRNHSGPAGSEVAWDRFPVRAAFPGGTGAHPTAGTSRVPTAPVSGRRETYPRRSTGSESRAALPPSGAGTATSRPRPPRPRRCNWCTRQRTGFPCGRGCGGACPPRTGRSGTGASCRAPGPWRRPLSWPYLWSSISSVPPLILAPCLLEPQDVVHVAPNLSVHREAKGALQPLHSGPGRGPKAAVGVARVEPHLLELKLHLHHVLAGDALAQAASKGDGRLDAHDLDGSAHRHPPVQPPHIPVEHADAAGAGPAADGVRLVGAVDAVNAPRHVEPEPTGADPAAPVAPLVHNPPLPDRRQRRRLGPSDGDRVRLVGLAVRVDGQGKLLRVDHDGELALGRGRTGRRRRRLAPVRKGRPSRWAYDPVGH